MDISLIGYLLIIFSSAFIFGFIFKFFKQPPVIGYLISGIVMGLFFTQAFAHETISFLAELGVILLLFTIGLEFPFEKFQAWGKPIVIAAIAQVILSIFLFVNILLLLNWTLYSAIYAACAFSMSSTAIVIKILTDKGSIQSLPGQILKIWLLVQDLCVLPMLMLLPFLHTVMSRANFSYDLLGEMIKNMLIMISVLILVFVIAKYILPKILEFIGKYDHGELYSAFIFLVVILAAGITQILGLAAGLGAFLIGVIISRTSQNQFVFSQFKNFRDLFALIFFSTLGLLLPLDFVIANLSQILLISLSVMLLKFLITTALTYYFGYHSHTAFIVGTGLINVGEFAFVLASTGYQFNLINLNTYAYIISVALVSIIFSPSLFLQSNFIYLSFKNITQRHFPRIYGQFFTTIDHSQTMPDINLKNHVVLLGYGRVGKYIGRALDMANISYIVVDYDLTKINALQKAKVAAIFGDPTDIDILDLAQVDLAKFVIIALPDIELQKQIVLNCKKLNKEIKIFCRVHREQDQAILKALGVFEIVQPEFTAATFMTQKILAEYHISDKDIAGKITRLKIEHGI